MRGVNELMKTLGFDSEYDINDNYVQLKIKNTKLRSRCKDYIILLVMT